MKRFIHLLMMIFACAASADPKLPGVVFYDKVKAFEKKTQWPTPNTSFYLATFDPTTGVYKDLSKTLPKGPVTYSCLGCAGTQQPGVVNSVDVTFKIQLKALTPAEKDPLNLSLDGKPPPAAPPAWKGRKEDVTFKCNGRHYHVSKMDLDAVCTIGRTESFVNWEISSGKRKHSGGWSFMRPPVIGAGAMTVGAVPMLVIYAPPPDSQKKSEADYTDMKSMGSTVSFSWGQSDSTKKPADQQPYADVATVKQIADYAKKGKDVIGMLAGKGSTLADGAGTVSQALSFIADSIGSATETTEFGHSTQGSKSLTLTTKNTTTYQTNGHDGPGRSDLIVYLKNARFVWLASPEVHVALVAYEGTALVTVDLLRSERTALIAQKGGLSPKLKLDLAAVESMMRLDPFVDAKTFAVNLNPKLDPHRFVQGVGFDVVSGSQQFTWTTASTATNGTALTNASTHMEDYSAGAFAFLGIGVTETKTTKATVTNGSATGNSVANGTSLHVKFMAAPGELYRITPYYDRVFGTFAYVPDPAAAANNARLAGPARMMPRAAHKR